MRLKTREEVDLSKKLKRFIWKFVIRCLEECEVECMAQNLKYK